MVPPYLFDPSQPDLNWDNPEVIAEFHDVLRYWLDRGIDGFRVDVAHGLVKDMSFLILRSRRARSCSFQRSRSPVLGSRRRPRHHPWLASVIDEYDAPHDGGRGLGAPSDSPRYLRPDEYHQSFNFDFLGPMGCRRAGEGSLVPSRPLGVGRGCSPQPGSFPTTTSCAIPPAMGSRTIPTGDVGLSTDRMMSSTRLGVRNGPPGRHHVHAGPARLRLPLPG